MLQNFVKLFGGNPNRREIEKLGEIVARVNDLEHQFETLSDEALRLKTDEFRQRLAEGESLDDILPEAFTVVREASKRTVGLRPYDVQIIGGVVLHRGQIAEMKTGEGKTLVATLPLYLNALTGKGCHLVTVNDYLARRDARWMGPIYNSLGLSVGILQMAAATENARKAFLYDPERTSPREDQDRLRMVDRRMAYQADITYGTNAEFGFDYLRDNMTMRLEDRVQRGHHYAIVDEVDNVLIDEARTPLIISGPAAGDIEWYARMAQIVRQLKPEDYEVSERDRSVALTEVGTAHVEQLLGQPLSDPDRPEDVNPEQARLLGYLEQALRAQHLFRRNKDYLVQSGKVIIVDEFTGRLMPGRRWSDGLHQAVEAKEGVRVEPENITYATITLQNYFRMYAKLAGMTGTALTEAEEFHKIYTLEVMPIPTNLEFIASQQGSPLVETKTRDEDGFEYAYYAHRDDQGKKPAFWRRKDYPDVIYRSLEAKLRALVREIIVHHVRGQPMLVGTTSVESSERLSGRLRAELVRRLAQILLIRHAWLKANDRFEDGRIIPELKPFYRPLDQMRPEDLRPTARELGLSLNPEDPANLALLREILGLDPEDEPRLKATLQGGIPHQVLNARRHTEESQIIAGAGAFGAVTIATNMAGRGVDIKLGGELAEEVIASVNRVLRKAGHKDAYEMSLQERHTALQEVDPALYGIYESEVEYYLKHFEDMKRVKELGGLHVIGSERHEARRIDNQLRGRSARQGDPGSSRFYLSLEDDLMRLFGGEQVKGMMDRLSIDDDYPIAHRIVTGAIEQSQHRVEGANFDVRKHLLEYDDVLNSQRMRIYAQRDRVFTKEDLTEDMAELLRAEIQQRVPSALEDEEGPWRLLAWLEQIQPPLLVEDRMFPSYAYHLLLNDLEKSKGDPKTVYLDLVERAIESEHQHLLRAIEIQIGRVGESLEGHLQERLDTLDTYFDALRDSEEEPRRPQEIVEEISGLVHMPLRLSPDQMRLLTDDPDEAKDLLRGQIESAISNLTITRLLGAVEHRLGESLELPKGTLQDLDWDEASDQILEAVQHFLEKRRATLLGENGLVVRDLEIALQHPEFSSSDESARMRVLFSLAQGTRTAFDAKSHRQVRQAFFRFSYIFTAARLLEGRHPEQVTEDVLNHLQAAQAALQKIWGEKELSSLFRQVLLGAITEHWVDYLTRVEALRVSVGLEAYAQRDPLVQYKGQASEMFQDLLREIRSAVISHIFLYRPRTAGSTQAESIPQAVPASASSQPDQTRQKKKKRRHRH